VTATAPRAELVLDARATLGESPVWDPDRRLLWWVDILGGVVHGFDPATGGDRAIAIGEAVGAIALRASGDLIVAAAGRIGALDPETGRIDDLVTFEPETPPRRTNDAKCDPTGALWVGRMALDGAPGLGSLLRLDPDLRLTIVETGLAVPNGMAWSTDGRRMYFIDSLRRQITDQAFDAATRMVEPGRPLLEFSEDAGLPDGMTIDTEGCLWVAMWNGGRVLRIAPDGRAIGGFDVPGVSQASSCTFGGDDLGDLYITTARETFTDDDAAREPSAGGLFRVRPGPMGVVADRFVG
jgi:sugar lactone lactonase YvrE